jgi:hypothetical protein
MSFSEMKFRRIYLRGKQEMKLKNACFRIHILISFSYGNEQKKKIFH